MHLLIPGRHHLLTDFQFQYLFNLIELGLENAPDVNGKPLGIREPVESVIFAVTSANHSNTRRNPVPFHLRAMMIQDFAQHLDCETFVFGIDDVGFMDDFAGYCLKKIRHDSEGQINLSPENTVVVCSTAVLKMYERLGFRVLPAELKDRETWEQRADAPWPLVQAIADHEGDWRETENLLPRMHRSAWRVWTRYSLGEKVQRLFRDEMISADGNLTETRDYNAYVRQMDQIAELKFRETAPFLRSGRVGDIGCAVGSWIQLACREEKLRESDFFGIEVARPLYRICLQRKENGDFDNPNVFFSQKNAVTELCFEPSSMNTIHTSSLTHEIESYGSREDLLQFIQKRFLELAPGGVWVNRDVVGPAEGDKKVFLWLNAEDGRNEDWEAAHDSREALEEYLSGLSTKARFRRFARDFRKGEESPIEFSWQEIEGVEYAALALRDAMEFISKKDYVGNWASEMHEKFCFWSYENWVSEMEKAGFYISENSGAYTNQWLVENRYSGKAELFELHENSLLRIDYPDTHMVLVGERRG